MLDFDKFTAAAHDHGVPLIVDNTFATPINCRPFEWGADIVTHSTTKYMDGHGSCVGGAIVDSGRFDWTAHADKFPGLTTPDDSYHGVTYATDFGPAAYIIKATAQLMRDFGSTPAPINSWIMGMHLESLAVRMERHCANALAVARFLEADPRISWVSYPGLEGDRNHALAAKYMPNGTCGVISFGVPGGRDTVSSLLDHFRMISIATHVADARSCTLYPAGTTHRQLTEEQLEEAGVGIDLVRLSCGIEKTPMTSSPTSGRPWTPCSDQSSISLSRLAKSFSDTLSRIRFASRHQPAGKPNHVSRRGARSGGNR